MNKIKTDTIVMYAIIFAVIAVIISIIAQFSIGFIAVFGMIALLLGAVVGWSVSEVVKSKEIFALTINPNRLNEKEILVAILVTLVFWLLLRYFLGDSIIITILGLIFGWFIGRKIVKLIRRKKK